jgi:hypothetical protein
MGQLSPDVRPCWEATRQVRPGPPPPHLVITGASPTPPGKQAPARPGGAPRALAARDQAP